jgi:tetratricopeptide (TPR) repeat protein
LVELNEAIRIDPKFAMAYNNRAKVWEMKHDLDHALADLNEAIRLDPRDVMALDNRGWIHLARNQPDQAVADAEQALHVNPRDVRAYGSRAGGRMLKGQLDLALADCDETIRLAPRDPGFRCNRARVWIKKGQFDRALADLDESIRIEPRFVEAHGFRASILAACPDAKYRDGSRAVDAATRCCELAGWKSPYALEVLAAAYAEIGDFGSAVKWQSQANAAYADAGSKTEGEARLKLYQAKKPCRQVAA